MSEQHDFTIGSIPRAIMRLSVPMIGAQVINALYSMVDRMYIARLPDIGTAALTGVGLTFPLVMIVSAFAMLAGMGGAPLCSIARGEKQHDYAERVMGNAFTLLMILGVMITALLLIFRRPVLVWFGASAQTLPYADEYSAIYLSGSLFVMATLGLTPFINAQGFARMGMITVALGAVLNIALDPLFMFTFGMGVRGAALATVLSQAVSAAWILIFLTGKKSILKLRRRHMRLDLLIVRRILALGASNCVMNLTECIVIIVCNRTLSQFGGDLYMGVMTVISSIRQILMMPMTGFCQGLQPVIGYNYGARRYDRVRHGVMFTLKVTTVYAAVCCALTLGFPAFFIGLFSPDEALIAAGIAPVRVYFCLFAVLSLQMTGQYSFVALGKSVEAMFFSLLRKAFIVAPMAYLLPRVTNLGAMGVFAAEPISDLVGSTACFVTFMLTVWPMLKRKEGLEA